MFAIIYIGGIVVTGIVLVATIGLYLAESRAKTRQGFQTQRIFSRMSHWDD